MRIGKKSFVLLLLNILGPPRVFISPCLPTRGYSSWHPNSPKISENVEKVFFPFSYLLAYLLEKNPSHFEKKFPIPSVFTLDLYLGLGDNWDFAHTYTYYILLPVIL